MALANLLPPRDLLEQVEGVESGLRRSRRASLIGVLLAAVQATILLANSQWLQSLASGDWTYVLDHWPLLVSLFLLVLAVLVVSWTRFWMTESKQSFRYTYSIAPFEPLAGSTEEPLLLPLHADLRERLSERIGRLSLLEGDSSEAEQRSDAAEGAAPAQAESHIHVSGTYAVRVRPPDPRRFLEIVPWVHVGGADRPGQLATPVRYALDAPISPHDPSPTPQEYEHILERAYFTIATAIYRQIQDDVKRKIDLLPSRWFRASAIFHEAEDHARSNTLDAYQTALRLYWRAILLYDPTWAPPAASPVRRRVGGVRAAAAKKKRAIRTRLSHLIAAAGRAELLTTRAEIGYANMLLETLALAGLSGLRDRPGYAAAPIARDARDRLHALGMDVPDRKRALFDALVCLAHAEEWLGATDRGEEALKEAASLDPRRAEAHARYLYAKARLEPRLKAKISGFRHSVEHGGERFEAARFDYAYHSEMLWRTRPTLERSIADSVREQYEAVLKVNPSNLGAWANRGYVAWLLGEEEDLEAAKRCFDTGRRFKEMKQETYVAELDQGLARVAAETGDFEQAYAHYVACVSARISEGSRQAYHAYYYERIGPEILARYKKYARSVGKHYATPREDQLKATTSRIRRSVYAFALGDYGEACFEYFLAVGDPSALDAANVALRKATELNEDYVVPWLALANVEWERQQLEGAEGEPNVHADRVEALEPDWEEAAPQLLAWHHERARELRRKAQERRDAAERAGQATIDSGPDRPDNPSYPTEAPEPMPPRVLHARATQLDEEADRHEMRARDLIRVLIPHAWLWRRSPDGAEMFAWDRITSDDESDRLRWEQSFDIFHVRGLLAWCWVLAQQEDPPEHFDSLLDLIEERFLPSDLELIGLRRYRAQVLADREDTEESQPHAETATRYGELQAQKVGRALDEDPRSFAVLRLVEERDTSSAPRLVERAKADGLPPFIYAWVGRELLQRSYETADEEDRELANTAFDKATVAKDARTLLQVGDGLADLGRVREALESFRKAMPHAKEPGVMVSLAQRLETYGEPTLALELLVKARSKDRGAAQLLADEYYAVSIARARWLAGARREAVAELSSIPRSGGELGTYWRTDLIQTLSREADMDVEAYALLRPWLAAGQRRAIHDGDDEIAQDCAGAARALAQHPIPAPWVGEADAAAEAFPFGMAIRLEGSDVFYPRGPDTPAVERMLQQEIPRLREEVRTATGVVLPGISLRSESDLPDRGYRILINDVEVETGIVAPDEADPYRFMLDRVAVAVSGRLATFVDLQALEAMGSAADETGRPPVQQQLQSERERRAFLRFVKAQVRDGVAIGDLGTLLDVYLGRGPSVAEGTRALEPAT